MIFFKFLYIIEKKKKAAVGLVPRYKCKFLETIVHSSSPIAPVMHWSTLWVGRVALLRALSCAHATNAGGSVWNQNRHWCYFEESLGLTDVFHRQSKAKRGFEQQSRISNSYSSKVTSEEIFGNYNTLLTLTFTDLHGRQFSSNLKEILKRQKVVWHFEARNIETGVHFPVLDTRVLWISLCLPRQLGQYWLHALFLLPFFPFHNQGLLIIFILKAKLSLCTSLTFSIFCN